MWSFVEVTKIRNKTKTSETAGQHKNMIVTKTSEVTKIYDCRVVPETYSCGVNPPNSLSNIHTNTIVALVLFMKHTTQHIVRASNIPQRSKGARNGESVTHVKTANSNVPALFQKMRVVTSTKIDDKADK